MQKRRFISRSSLGTALVSCLVATIILIPTGTAQLDALASTLQATNAPTPTVFTPTIPNGSIKHIVFFIKENRTFDNYFGTYPGANGATTATTSDGKVVPLQHQSDQLPFDVDHASRLAIFAYDESKMDRFDRITTIPPVSITRPYSNHSLTQVWRSDIPN